MQGRLLTMDEIDRLRRNLKMTWPEFANYVFVGIATLKRWKRGEIQTQALDRLVRLRADPRFLEAARMELHARRATAARRRAVGRRPSFEWVNVAGGAGRAPVVRAGGSDLWKGLRLPGRARKCREVMCRIVHVCWYCPPKFAWTRQAIAV